jgi:hypothetical protein
MQSSKVSEQVIHSKSRFLHCIQASLWLDALAIFTSAVFEIVISSTIIAVGSVCFIGVFNRWELVGATPF